MSRAPVHIMRFAPADYLLDAFVQRCYRTRSHRTLAFYTGFLFRSHLEGGSLPADPHTLASYLSMQVRDVVSALQECVTAGKLKIENGRVFHKRVVAEVSDELAYRAQQAEFGKKRGGPRKPPTDDDGGEATLFDAESPPAPLPAPSPGASASAPASGEPGHLATEELRGECRGMLQRVINAAGPSTDGQIELTRASRTPSGRVITSLDAPRLTTAWLRTTQQRLVERLLSLEADAAPAARGSPLDTPSGRPGVSEVTRQGLDMWSKTRDARRQAERDRIQGGDGEALRLPAATGEKPESG